MKVVCAWCQREQGPPFFDEEQSEREPISHGICDEHVVLVLAEARRSRVGDAIAERLAS